MSKSTKSWAALVSGDQEQVQNGAGVSLEKVRILKRQPNKSIAKLSRSWRLLCASFFLARSPCCEVVVF
jgi:hypothetical protein